MKKNLLKLLIVAMFAVVLTAALVACNGTTIQKVDFTITFDVDGETYFEIKTQGSEVLEMPTNPTKENYIFDGWYWDKDEWQRPFTASSLANEPLTGNLTVYAKWTEVELTQKIFTVTFNSMGGTAVEPVKVQYGKLLTAPERPTKLGYALVGWYKEADLSTKWDFNLDKVTEDLTLYAKWVDESDATGCEILNATDFEKDGNTYSIKVANSQEHFVLSQAITVSPYAEWTVTSDIAGKEVIPSATVDLKVGDNTYYINVVSGTGSNKNQYTIKIRRREIYNVTYQFGNGQADETISVEEDSKPENKTPEDKQGYSFEGWLLDDELWKFDTDVVTKTITLVAKWNANGYEVTLDSRDGSTVDAQQVTYDATFNFPTSDKNGYIFQGWETAEGVLLTDAHGAGLDVWKNTDDELTLYAKWQLNTYTITYHGVTDHGPIKNTLTNGNPAQYTVELADIELSTPTSAGYTFEKWYEDAEFQTPIETIDTARAENLDLYAKFALVTYTAKFYADDNKVGDDVSFTVETTSITEPSVPDKTGYTGKWADYTIGAQDLTIKAEYTVIVYDIEYLDTKDADNPNRKTYTIEDSDITLLNITAVGYNFLGWFDEEQDGEHAVEKIAGGSSGKKTFTAHWSAIHYTLKLEYDEHIFKYAEGDSNPNSFDIESNFELKGLEAYAVGYHFIGWFTEKNNGDGEQVTAIEPGRHEDLTLYAHYGLEEYTITYHNVEGIENTNATTYTVLSEEITIHALSKNGYNFDGWFSDEDCLTEADTTIETGSHGNLNFYAKWTPIQYPLTFQLAGGHYEDGESNKEFYTIEDSFTFVEPKYEGYRFDGWFTLADGGDRQTGIVEGTTGNKTFYAHWTRITTLHFDSNDGSPVEDMLVPAGDEISAPQVPTRDYYTFAYWCSDEACEHEFTFYKMPENDQTLYAKWTPIEYTIHYVLYGGDNNEGNPETYNVESHVTLLQPTKTGYTFNAWFKNAQFTGETVEEIAVGSHDEITLYASFTINQYTMSFNTHEGTTIDDITQNYDTLITPPSNPAKLGYSFAGWYKDAEHQEEYTIGRMPAENLTLHAKWELVEYNIHYNLDNGDNNELNPEIYNIESNGVTLHDPSKNGYTFKGWYSDSKMETQIESIPAGSYGVKEVYAKWEVIEYDISYNVPEGTINNNILKYTIETDITILEEGELLGHKFEGWFRDPSYETQVTQIGGGETGELTLYGKFTPNEYTIWLDGNEEGTAIVSFNTMGGNESYSEQHITEQQGLEYPGNPTKDGFLFGGWYANRECEGTPYDFTAQVGGNVTLYAKWISYGEANTINVGGTATVKLNGKTDIIYRFVPVVSGNISITTEGDIDTLGTLYLGERQLKQNDDDGDKDNFLIVYNVTAGQLYEIRVRAFSASADGEVILSVSGNTTVPAGGRTLAKFDSKTVTFGESFDLPVRTGEEMQKFLGWQDANGVLYADEHGNSVKNWDKDADTVLYSKWEKMEYTVTFQTNGGSPVNSTNTITLEYGARLDLNSYITNRPGFTFVGWYLSASDSVPYDASTMPDYSFVLYAKWVTYSLGAIKYDEDKKAISEYDELTADLFDAVCLDSNGEPATFTVVSSGEKKSGQMISIRLIANGGGTTRQITISNVKVYGTPSLEILYEKDYINLQDGLNANWFGAHGVDTYGEPTTVLVRIDDGYAPGNIVTVFLDSIDIAGNVLTKSIQNVRLYGLPNIIVEDENIKSSEVLSVDSISASATDSFGEKLDVSVLNVKSGLLNAEEFSYITSTSYNYQYFKAFNNETYTLHYKNEMNNIKTYLMIYCVTTGLTIKSDSYTTVSEYTTYSFSAIAGYEYYVRTYAYNESNSNKFYMYLTSKTNNISDIFSGELEVTLSASDKYGNNGIVNKTIYVYSAPVINEPCNVDFKIDDVISVESMGLTAVDSFGNLLPVSIILNNGEQKAGVIMNYIATAIDKAGNISTAMIELYIYGKPSISYDREGLNDWEDPSHTIIGYTVKFDLNDEKNDPPVIQQITYNNNLVYPETPIRDGYIFRGWYTERECVNLYNFQADIESDITLFAGWVAVSSVDTGKKLAKQTIIDITNQYNSSDNTFALRNGYSTFSDDDEIKYIYYTYFTAYTAGTYTFYYKYYPSYTPKYPFQSYEAHLGVTNLTTSSTILSERTLYSNDSYLYVSFDANAGDVFCIKNYGRRCKVGSSTSYNYYYADTYIYVTGGKKPQDGGSINYNCNHYIYTGADLLGATAKDSFGNPLQVTATVYSGSLEKGNYIIYELTTFDKLGNSCTIYTSPIGIYDGEKIAIQYMNMASDLVKISSHGEEFFASATDCFGQPCEIIIEAAEGYMLEPGTIIDLYLIAVDKAGNRKQSELITGIKVYGTPYAKYTKDVYTINKAEDLSFLYTVYDSFGEEIPYTYEIMGELKENTFVNIKFSAKDIAGNQYEFTEQFFVEPNNIEGIYVELISNSILIERLFLDDWIDYCFQIPTVDGFQFIGYSDTMDIKEETVFYTDKNGQLQVEILQGTSIRLYAIFVPNGYEVIRSAKDFKSIDSSANYYLLNDIDCSDAGNIGGFTNYDGIFEGNNKTISNVSIITYSTTIGLFKSTTSKAIIRNLTIDGLTVNKSSLSILSIGGCLVGTNNGTIENCQVHKVSMIWTGTAVEGFGGIAGDNRGRILNCAIDGTLDVSVSYASQKCTLSYESNGNCWQKMPSVKVLIGGICYSNSGTITNVQVALSISAVASFTTLQFVEEHPEYCKTTYQETLSYGSISTSAYAYVVSARSGGNVSDCTFDGTTYAKSTFGGKYSGTCHYSTGYKVSVYNSTSNT